MTLKGIKKKTYKKNTRIFFKKVFQRKPSNNIIILIFRGWNIREKCFRQN